MKKLLFVSGLLVVMLFGTSLTFADPQAPGYGPGPGRIHIREGWGAGKDLDFTPEQRAKFQELRKQFMADNAQLIGALVTKRLELQSLWTDPKAEPKTIMDTERELRDIQNQLRDKGVQSLLEAWKFLTAEQISHSGLNWGMGWGGMMGWGGHGRMLDSEMGHGMGPGIRRW